MNEADLRDIIAGSIEKLKPGLTLLKKEQYIPDDCGTRSFIDLYAKDFQGRHVLIELKKNDATARQAIHEVNKYVERIKGYFGSKDEEIHVIIASTNWKELLLPFSRFSSDTSFSVEGLMVHLDETLKDFTVETIEPLPITEGRVIAPWHNVNWYVDKNSLEKGIASIENCYSQKGIKDYTITIFHIKTSKSDQRQARMCEIIEGLQQMGITQIDEKRLSNLPTYEYIAYVSLQTLKKDICLKILSKDIDTFESTNEIISNMEGEEEILSYLHDCVEALEPRSEYDYYDIGYPAKFSLFLDNPENELIEIKRYGIFTRNKLLTDDTIISELRGEDGSTGQKIKKNINMQINAHVINLKQYITDSLSENPVWKNQILRIIDEIKEEFPDAEIDVSVFNPCTGVFTVYYALAKENGMLHIPTYTIKVKIPDIKRVYFGAIMDNGFAINLKDILKKYYDGELGNLLILTTCGGRDERDNDIMEDMGLSYKSFRCDINGEVRKYFILKDDKWKDFTPVDPIILFEQYLEKNEKLVHQIMSKFQPRDKGFMFDASPADIQLDKKVDVKLFEKKEEYFASTFQECDICTCSFENEKYMIYGKIHDESCWVCMCADCFKAFGEGIGLGFGQLYLKNKKGWLLVGGSEKSNNDLKNV